MSAQPKDASAPLAEPKQAAAEVLAGQPGPTARRWLGPTALVVFVLFAIDTFLVVTKTRCSRATSQSTWFIQQLNWGPLVYPMELINASAGIWQVLLGAVAIVALFIFERRAGWLMLIGSISSLLDNLIKLVISRQRPPADLVHILSPTTGFSFPSGHAVFFTWMAFMIAVSIAPKIRPAFRPVLWILAVIVIVLTCIARVWAGAHWPSDVFGGVLLGSRLVGVRAVAARALAAVPELPMVSRARPGEVMIRVPVLAVAIAAAAAVGVITAIVVMHPYLSLDATVERDIQATNLGPLTLTFPFLTWLGGPGGVPMQIVVILLVLLLNRRAWVLALAALAGGLWYEASSTWSTDRGRPSARSFA